MRLPTLLLLLLSSSAFAGADPDKKVDAPETKKEAAAPHEEALKPAEKAHASPVFVHYDHQAHNARWALRDLNCMSCHQFGADGKVSFPGPLQAVCHQCHVQTGDQMPIAPDTCTICHDIIPKAGAVGASPVYEVFPHDRHVPIFPARNLTCTSCHAVGDGGKAVFDGHLMENCHQCHNPSDGSKRLGPGRCETCHKEPPVPSGHGAGWTAMHGADARADLGSCRQCHKAKWCVDCHELKETVRWNVHDRSWVDVHGIAARTDPTSCDTCHAKVDCTTCHANAGGRW